MKYIKLLAFSLLVTAILLLSNCNTVEEKNEKENKKEEHAEETVKIPYEELGFKFAMATKGVLGKNLLGALNAKGTEKALEFCSEKAYPLTDSMALALNVTIKRVSDKPRNPKNAASESELAYISMYMEKIKNGESVKPKIQEIGDKVVGYYPIMTNEMCMQCHGKPNTIMTSEVLNIINDLYPDDKATGYDVDQLRGIWVVEMDKNISAD